MLNHLTFEPCAALSHESRLIAAALVRSALPELYSAIDDVTADEILARQLAELGNEISSCEAALKNGVPVGVLAAYPAQELSRRQSVGLHQLLIALSTNDASEVLASVRRIRAEIHGGAKEGHYLARLAVADKFRGAGLADALICRMLECASAPYSLHVRGDNERAIRFYQRHGFRSITSGSRYTFMSRAA